MKFFKIIIGIFLISTIGLEADAQQRPITGTYMYNGLILNPAYAGSLNLFSATFVNRDQWVNVDNAPVLQSFNAHTSLKKNRIGVGLQAFRDKLGVREQTGIYASYAYKIRMKGAILAMGIQGGFDNRTADFSELNLFNPNDPLLTGVDTRLTPNFGTGIYLANRDFFIGLSVPYILENTISNIEGAESRESRYYYATAGNVIPLSENLKLNPSVLLRFQENAKMSFDLNANLIFENVAYAGISYRSSNAFTFVFQLILNENMRVGYAYETETSDIQNYTLGSHEILLNYRIKIKSAKKDPSCPVYF
ncbi:MAG: type IX secretion system membrane protein PorP/SprF [Bacteroidota bacterium]